MKIYILPIITTPETIFVANEDYSAMALELEASKDTMGDAVADTINKFLLQTFNVDPCWFPKSLVDVFTQNDSLYIVYILHISEPISCQEGRFMPMSGITKNPQLAAVANRIISRTG